VIVVPKSHIRERVEYIKGPKDVANIWLLPKVRRRKKKKKKKDISTGQCKPGSTG
jgi:hypothetical protein